MVTKGAVGSLLYDTVQINPGSFPGHSPASGIRSFFSSIFTSCLAVPVLWWDQSPNPLSSVSCCTKLSSHAVLFSLTHVSSKGHRRGTICYADLD